MNNNNRDFYLYVEGKPIKVSEEVYREYKRSEDKERYFMKRLKRGRVQIDIENGTVEYIPSREISLERMLEMRKDIIAPNESADDMLIKEEMLKRLNGALNSLPEDEQELINDLFFLGKTERQAADLRHVSQMTINKRKNRILEKLKKFFL